MEAINMDKLFVHLHDGGQILASAKRFAEGGYTVSFFHFTEHKQSHPDYWELHPNGDELIFVLEGKIQAECITVPEGELKSDATNNLSRLDVNQGQGVVIPKGFRHRLLLVEESKMIVVTRIEGTKHIAVD